MQEQRVNYVEPHQIADLMSRARFAKGGLEACIERLKKPTIPEYREQPHPFDSIANELGMRGAELEALHNEMIRRVGENKMLFKAYKEALLVTKLVYGEDALIPVRARQRTQRENYERAEQEKIRRQTDYSKRIKDVTRNWTEVSATVEARFRKIIRSLKALARKEPNLREARAHDVVLIEFLVSRGLAVVKDQMLIEVADSLLEMERPMIEDFAEDMYDYLVLHGQADKKFQARR